MRNYPLLLFILLMTWSCSPAYKVGDKVFATDEVKVYSFVDTLTMAEFEVLKINDVVEQKKLRNNIKNERPYMWETHKIKPDQFYKLATGLIGTVKSVGEYSDGKRNEYFYEIEFEKSVKLDKDEDSFRNPMENKTLKVRPQSVICWRAL